jgi:tetrahydromethanopterin S-methyltransferase subunit B
MKVERYMWTIVLMVFLGAVFVMGFMFAQDQESRAMENTPGHNPAPSTAADYHNMKYGIIVAGIFTEVLFGFWIWRTARVEQTKYGLVKLVVSGEMTMEEAAKKLGVSREVMKDAIKELKKEGVVE